MQMLKRIVRGEMVVVGLAVGFVVAGFLIGVFVFVRFARYCSRYSFPRRCIDGIRVIEVVSSDDGTVKFRSVVFCGDSSVVMLLVGGSASATVVVERVESCRG